MKNPYFGRLLTAMVTPFTKDGVNLKATADLADWLVKKGNDGLVVEGSTGEAATMTLDEKKAVLQAVIDRVGKKCKVIVGAGTNSTQSTIELIKALEPLKPDGFLVVGPYYNKPTQAGYFEHSGRWRRAPSCPLLFIMCRAVPVPIFCPPR